ncbi:MAG: hypothetical protein CVT48_04950 [Thermoplasmata archaeon HGW-Thermoplasmata-1]|nr:MAG: hypothetical protein CVT48_04950 [Thermoplasmata archaeon HGW-Thermoplasmata-1]
MKMGDDKKRAKKRCISRDEEGVTNILSAILLVGLFTIVIVTVQSVYVPVWMTDREAGHMEVVKNELAQIESLMGLQALNRDKTTLSSPLTMGGSELGIFLSSRSNGNLRVDPADLTVKIASPQIRVRTMDGADYGAIYPGTAQPLNLGQEEVELDISAVRYFVLNVSEADFSNSEWGRVNMSVRTASDELIGYAWVTVYGYQSSTQVWVSVFDANGVKLFDQPDINYLPPNNKIYNHRMNMLDPRYRFVELLNIAEAPYRMNIVLTKNGGTITADYAITYDYVDPDSGGTVIIGGGGKVFENFDKSYTAGALVYNANNLYFVDQIYTHMMSGVVLTQPGEGSTYVVEPAIEINTVGNRTVVSMLMLNVTQLGGHSTLSSADLATVQTRYISGGGIEGQAKTLTFILKTDDAPSLMRYIDFKMDRAGLEKETHYITQLIGNELTVSIFGKGTADIYDIDLTFTYAAIGCVIGSGGMI